MLDMIITHLTPGHLVLQWIPFEECEEVSLLYGAVQICERWTCKESKQK